MATLLELNDANQVFRIDPVLSSREQEWRSIYILPDLKHWLENELPIMGSTWNLEQTPAEQLDDLIATFCAGETLTFEWQFRPLRYVSGGIWELKTADLRMFGWFHQRDCFIGADANSAEFIKEHNLYQGYGGQVARHRDALDLDEPKYIHGSDPNAVVSNYDIPE